MQSHDDFDAHTAEKHDRALREKAERMTAELQNLITAGRADETEEFSAQVGGVFVRQMPADPLALRVSIGRGRVPDSTYCVIRGNAHEIITLVGDALAALKRIYTR
jgi:hypothetical protein